MKKWSNLDIAQDLVECLEQFYSEEVNGLKRLPQELSKYSGLISVALGQAQELRDNLLPNEKELIKSNIRKVKLKDGEIQSFWYKGEKNPCKCGSNLFHEEYIGKHLYGVCNACDRDIYELEYDEEYIRNSEWRNKK